MFKNKEVLPILAEPTTFMRQFTKEFDRLFEDRAWPFYFAGRPQVEEYVWRPEIDVFEFENNLKIRVDLPGLTKEDIKVEVTDVGLIISGERKREIKEEKGEYFRAERIYGTFSRTIPLPEGTKLEEVKAAFVNGVLEVMVPLAARIETKPRLVPIGELPLKVKTAA